jgi:hypothetical protein
MLKCGLQIQEDMIQRMEFLPELFRTLRSVEDVTIISE